MGYNTKNYTEQGGEKTVIGGTLEIKEGAFVTGLSPHQITIATETALGGIKAAPKAETDTVPAKIDEDGILYVPTYPVVPETPVVDYQAPSTAEDIPGLLADFNALLTKLIAAGIMATD